MTGVRDPLTSPGAGRARWAREVDSVRRALAPWVIVIEGQEYISAAAPAGLRELHAKLASVGYANGWVA